MSNIKEALNISQPRAIIRTIDSYS
uniref:Uncharacterized protein n=1 Tax=Anguilla anguilla TaxID=7936 RepID=A0A0E9TK07_ANGAN